MILLDTDVLIDVALDRESLWNGASKIRLANYFC